MLHCTGNWEVQRSETGHIQHLYCSSVIICDLEVRFYLFYESNISHPFLLYIYIFSSYELVGVNSIICIDNMFQDTNRLLTEQKLLQIRVHKHAA